MKNLSDASTLTQAQRQALMAARLRPLIRVRNGWLVPVENRKVSHATASMLKAYGLVKPRIKAGRHELVLTWSGQNIAEMIKERAEQRNA